MKKSLLFTILLLASVLLIAQENNSRLNVKSLKLISNDTEASRTRKKDPNGENCALIKIQTPNMDEADRDKLQFSADLGTFTYPEKAVGEIKLFLTEGCKTLVIMHPDYGKFNYPMPIKVEGFRTYEMVLEADKSEIATKTISLSSNYVVINVTPKDALVNIDGKYYPNGKANLSVDEPHKLEVTHKLYHTYEKEIYSSAKEKITYDVNLAPAFGWLLLESKPESGATVLINGERKGTTPYRSDTLPSGVCEVTLMMNLYETETFEVIVKDSKLQKIEMPMKPVFAEVNISTDSKSDIYMDGEKIGTGQWKGRIEEGSHTLEARRESHINVSRNIDIIVGKAETIIIDNPIPILGGVDIQSEPDVAKVYLDGEYIGETPLIKTDVIIGNHILRFEKKGFASEEYTIAVSEGEIAPTLIKLKNSFPELFARDGINDAVCVDEQYYGMYPMSAEQAKSIGIPANYDELYRFFSSKDLSDNASAINNIGACYLNGMGVAKDEEEAVRCFERAMKLGSVVAKINMANCYLTGQGVSINYDAMYNLANSLENTNNAIALTLLGGCYENGNGVPQNFTMAVEWYRKAADFGYFTAQTNLGVCYSKGNGVPQDYTKAVEWFRKAADQGDARGQFNLGVCYFNGDGVPQDYTKAVEWYRKAADLGDAKGQFNLGVCYFKGIGLPQNYTKAVEWYRKAADQSLANGQLNLGVCYFYGNGVPQDYTKAVEWYRKAADQSFANAQVLLGGCYFYGNGVPQDYTKAVEWYRKAADQGYAKGQFLLGVCYDYGKGVTMDKTKAIEWYRKAADQGDESAISALKSLGVY